MKLFVLLMTQGAIFTLVGGYLTSTGELRGLAPAVLAAGAAYVLTVWPLHIRDWLRVRVRGKALSRL